MGAKQRYKRLSIRCPPSIWEGMKMSKAELMPTTFGLLKHPPATQPKHSFLLMSEAGGRAVLGPKCRPGYCCGGWQWVLMKTFH